MNAVTDLRLINRLAAAQAGVLSKADLQSALAERHPAAFVRRVKALENEGTLRRFCRGFYITEEFDLPTLSQRIAPESCVSFGTVLARELLIGTDPARQVMAVKVGRARSYAAFGYRIDHLAIAGHLLFGFQTDDGVRYAEPEKAVLDVFYYHLRGRRYPFDPFSDVDFTKLRRRRLREYLDRYQNPKFVRFVEGVLEI